MRAPDLLSAAILAVLAIHAILRLSVRRPGSSASAVPARVRRGLRLSIGRRPDPGLGRMGGRIATIVAVSVLILLTPTRGAPPFAGSPLLVADRETVGPGGVVAISGAGFEDQLQGQLALDGDPTGMPSFRVRGNGTFEEAFTVAPSAGVGPHVVSALGPELLASTVISVVIDPGLDTPSPSPSPTASPSPTPSPSPSPSPTPTPSPAQTPTPTPSPSPSPTPTPSPTATPSPPPSANPTGAIDYVFLVVMENHGYSQVWNTPSTPYTTALAQANARAAAYHAITHPSLPNYLDLYAGSNIGITNDCSPSSSCHSGARNLADNLESAGLTWKGYFETMPAPCSTSDSGGYVAHHNPFIYFDDIRTNAARCASHVVNYSALSADLASSSTTPDFSLIVPNNCNNTHDCSVATGDAWLSNNLPPILSSPACTTQRCLLVLTWDEDDGSQSNHVLTVFAGSAARKGYVTNAAYDHFDLLATVESLFGLPGQTANDAAATPMADMLK